MPALTKEQKQARRHSIGSSDIAEVIGVAPWENASPVRLFAEKTGVLGDDDEEEDGEEVELGHLLEPVLIALYERESGRQTLPGGTVTHRSFPWATATLDAKIIGVSAALECKAVGIGMHRGWDLLADDGIPHYVRCQANWQMGCADLEEIHVSVLMTGTRRRIFYVPRDRELETMLFDAGAEFWRRVQAKEVPPLDGSKGTRAYLDAKYPPPPKPVEDVAPKELEEIGRGLVLAKRRAKEETTHANQLGAELMRHMGDRGLSVLKGESWRATWSIPKKAGAKRRFAVKPVGSGWDPKILEALSGEDDDGDVF